MVSASTNNRGKPKPQCGDVHEHDEEEHDVSSDEVGCDHQDDESDADDRHANEVVYDLVAVLVRCPAGD